MPGIRPPPALARRGVDAELQLLADYATTSRLKPRPPFPSAIDVAVAVEALAAAAIASAAAAASMQARGAVGLAVRLLGPSEDDSRLLDALAALVAACAGTTAATAAALKVFEFNGVAVTVLEMPYHDAGLGWKVWGAALLLAAQLRAAPEAVRGRRVLELGAGCGLCGLLAAQLGAVEVALTDCVPAILDNLAAAVHLLPASTHSDVRSNAKGPAASGADEWSWSWGPVEAPAATHGVTKIRGGGGDGHLAASSCVKVRFLEWVEDNARTSLGPDATPLHAALAGMDKFGGCPRLAPEDVYDVIIGSDLVYEAELVEPLLGVIRRRLAWPDGVCHVVQAVRSLELLGLLTGLAPVHKLTVTVAPVEAEVAAALLTASEAQRYDYLDDLEPHPTCSLCETTAGCEDSHTSQAGQCQALLLLSGPTVRPPGYYVGGYVRLTLVHLQV
eukprot:SM000039S14512  [mRNA]  locus=s39:498908:501358:- [translate_table: standard]